jgi:hypothetical protein
VISDLNVPNRAGIALTRRQLFKAVGAGAVALGAIAPGSAEARRSVTPLALRVGLLTLQSSLHPELSVSWRAGLLRAINPSALFERSLSPGALSAEVARAVHGLIDAGAQLIIGQTDLAMLGDTQSALAKSGVAFVSSEFGTRMHTTMSGESDRVARTTLDFWQANWAMGQWLAQHQGTRAFVVMSFHESGYDQPYAFEAGFASAGGALAGSLVSDSPSAACCFADVQQQIEAAKPDLVYALLSGPGARAFARDYRMAGLAAQMPLTGSALFAHAVGSDEAVRMRTWRTWQDAASDPFSALGEHTGQQLVAAGIDETNLDFGRVLARLRANRGTQIVHIDEHTPQQKTLARLKHTGRVPKLDFDTLRSGWLHPYLSV